MKPSGPARLLNRARHMFILLCATLCIADCSSSTDWKTANVGVEPPLTGNEEADAALAFRNGDFQGAYTLLLRLNRENNPLVSYFIARSLILMPSVYDRDNAVTFCFRDALYLAGPTTTLGRQIQTRMPPPNSDYWSSVPACLERDAAVAIAACTNWIQSHADWIQSHTNESSSTFEHRGKAYLKEGSNRTGLPGFQLCGSD
jgi:hypothetical protein